MPHDLLLWKLSKYGIDGKNLNWIKNFLNGREQQVVINKSISQSIQVKSGVPQGGILSGLMFILFMNDLPDCFSFVKTSMYADDAKLYAPILDTDSTTSIQADLNSLSAWCNRWKMKLNAEKCFYIHYIPQNREKNYPIYFIDGIELERKENATDLGIVINENFKFHSQVNKACKKANQIINTIRRSFKSRNPRFLESMYKTYVRPHLEYCVQVWNPVNIGDINAIERVQNRFTRMLPQSSAMEQEERNRALNITSHKVRRLRGDLIYIYKMYDTSLFFPASNATTRGHSKKLNISFARNNVRKHSFALRSLETWNSLAEDIVNADNLNIFKSRLDTFLNNSLRTHQV